jgi:hypothetical protein
MPVTGRSIETTVITGRLGQNHTSAGDTKLLLGWWPVVMENPASKNDLGLTSFIVLTMMMKSSYDDEIFIRIDTRNHAKEIAAMPAAWRVQGTIGGAVLLVEEQYP